MVRPSQLPFHRRFIAIIAPEQRVGDRKEQTVSVIFAGCLAELALSLLCWGEGSRHLGSQPPEMLCFHIVLLLFRCPEEFPFRWRPSDGIYVTETSSGMGSFGFPSPFLGCCCHLGCEPAEPRCWPRPYRPVHGVITLSTALSHCPQPYHTVHSLLCRVCS